LKQKKDSEDLKLIIATAREVSTLKRKIERIDAAVRKSAISKKKPLKKPQSRTGTLKGVVMSVLIEFACFQQTKELV
jgi:hypothetical protein